MTGPLATLHGEQQHPLADDGAPRHVRLGSVLTGPDSFGMGLQVLVADWDAAGQPSVEAIRRLHAQRLGKKVFPLVVAITDRSGSVWLLGPNPDASVVGPIPDTHAARLLQAALDEPNGLAGRQRIAHLLRALSSTDLVGVTNSGLFATHYLTSVLPSEPDWEPAARRAQEWLDLRGEPLVDALGFSARRAAANALVLTTDSARPRAVAVLLKESESFDADSARFAVSPVAYGLSVAQREDAPWLMVLRGSQIRLYPARPGVGVGSRGQAETYFELDLALVSGPHAAYLDLAFSASALGADGAIARLLEGSDRFATGLGVRLRQRIYEEAIPTLAIAVARELERLGQPVGDDYAHAYRITLRILFRLLFQAYAEDRGLLPFGRNDRYTRNALKRWALDLVEQPDLEFDPNSHAIWDDLLQVWGVIDTGNTTWDVPAYNGGLFGTDPDLHPSGAAIADMRLDDAAVGHALRHLLVDATVDGGVGAVDFRALSVREFGTIYEGLLESSLSRADQPLTLDSNSAYVPAAEGDDVVVDAGEIYFHNASGERKATGSYFTPHFAVEHLLDRALDPALTAHLDQVAAQLESGDQAAATEMFFDFRVADLAMGSGHFLVSAIDRIETAMAAFLVDHELPGVTDELRRLETTAKTNLGDAAPDFEIEPSSLLRRQIARRCIYGLDINDVAVELARVAVWIHTFVPGLPMSTLDHNLVQANSLTGIGTIDEAIGTLDPSHTTGQLSLYSGPILDALEEARELLTAAANASEATKAEVRQAAQIHLQAHEAAQPTRLLFDAAVAARTGILNNLAGLDVDAIREAADQTEVASRVAQLQPAHLPYLFPEVFLRPNAGFDVLIGNPPWEKLHVEEHAWWGLRFPGLRGMRARDRERQLEALRNTRPDLQASYEAEVQKVDAMRQVIAAGPYPGIGAAHIDLYQAFAWRNWQLAREGGHIGAVLPRGALSGAGALQWRKTILKEGTFTDVCLLTNSGQWAFEGVDGRYTFALVNAARTPGGGVAFCGPFYSHSEYKAGHTDRTTATAEEFRSWSDTLAFPSIPDGDAGEIVKQMQTHPRFSSSDGFEFRPVQGDLNATGGRSFFDVDVANADGDIPVLAGASFDLWQPDFGNPYAIAHSGPLLDHLLEKTRRSATRARSPFRGLTINDVEDLPISRPRIALRDVTRATDSRTAHFCLIPPKVAVVHNAPYLVRAAGSELDEAYLLGVVSSIPFDWYTRRWVELHLTFQLLNPMPIPRPDPGDPRRGRVVELAGRLAAVDERYRAWADAVDVPVGTLQSEPERSDALAELDALVALLYGLTEDQVAHLFATFHRGWNYAARLEAVLDHYDAWRSRS